MTIAKVHITHLMIVQMPR